MATVRCEECHGEGFRFPLDGSKEYPCDCCEGSGECQGCSEDSLSETTALEIVDIYLDQGIYT